MSKKRRLAAELEIDRADLAEKLASLEAEKAENGERFLAAARYYFRQIGIQLELLPQEHFASQVEVIPGTTPYGIVSCDIVANKPVVTTYEQQQASDLLVTISPTGRGDGAMAIQSLNHSAQVPLKDIIYANAAALVAAGDPFDLSLLARVSGMLQQDGANLSHQLSDLGDGFSSEFLDSDWSDPTRYDVTGVIEL